MIKLFTETFFKGFKMSDEWRKCSICKKSINYGQKYQKCSVSTCKKSVYCSVDCWEVHVPVLGHKSPWAEEERAPLKGQEEERQARRILVTPKKVDESTDIPNLNSNDLPKDILIVISKLKAYVKARSDMNTSGDVGDALSEIVRKHVDGAIREARMDGRKTVMGRDFK